MAKYKKPKDTNQLAKCIVDIAVGDIYDIDSNAGKNAAASPLVLRVAQRDFEKQELKR